MPGEISRFSKRMLQCVVYDVFWRGTRRVVGYEIRAEYKNTYAYQPFCCALRLLWVSREVTWLFIYAPQGKKIKV
jgi:hypothetical protein